MKIEITEEEREFLYRVCRRISSFSLSVIPDENDLEKIRSLIDKLKKNYLYECVSGNAIHESTKDWLNCEFCHIKADDLKSTTLD